ncbi:carboxylesterase/lipase family protein [Nocardia iowensis]|uniref:Carboxylesterase family protein n=1 Tax=Nocardia iowensis TaxID=204891 RepID=A0ABX8RW41_NOCIO|nr:carboxylesterase family protein [Nocardia iowensis]QXN93092.1 carboxylesterase family protein [Nocardia iowensis]
MASSQSTVEVALPEGTVAGRIDDGYLTFNGIPYAAAPFGANRFRLPQPPERWDGVRAAFDFGPAAPQPDTFPFLGSSLSAALYPWGENCLTVNISTPDVGANRLPVMVWLHPGSYARGGAADTRINGGAFARDGVVCVTVGYRLGVDGFLAIPEQPLNLGLHDVLAALRWVQATIGRFGGDPRNVTAFGNSAGAGAIAAIARAAAAENLFGRAILQSAPLSLVADPDQAWILGKRVPADLGVSDVRDLPLDLLIERQHLMNDRFRDPEFWGPYSYLLTPFMPTVDGELIASTRLAERIPASIDLLVGNTRDEARFFLLPPELMQSATPESVHAAQQAYRMSAASIAAAQRLYKDRDAGEQLAETMTNQCFRGPAVELTESHSSAGGVSYAYEFTWRSTAFDGALGAAHALELPFLFDCLENPAVRALVGADAPRELGTALRRSWTDFARTGDPGWPAYELDNRLTMVFDENSEPTYDPRARHRPAWEIR